MKEKVISAGVVFNLIQYAHQRKIDLDHFDILSQVKSKDASAMVPFAHYSNLLTYVLEKTADDRLGIHIGKQYNLAALGIVGQLIQAAETIHDALAKACELFNLVTDVVVLNFQKTDDEFMLIFQADEETARRFPLAVKHFVISSMVYTHIEMSYLTLNEETPRALSLGEWDDYTEAMKGILHTDVVPGDSRYYLKYAGRVLQKRILWSDYDLFLQLEKVAHERLSKLDNTSLEFTHRVGEILLSLLNPHFPLVDEVADQLNLSVRDLQRKLKFENTSYQKIKASMQKELAKDYLSRGLSVKETCFLMGYSEPSAFNNAFNRWYGISPMRFVNRK